MADRAQEISTLADFSRRFLCPISLGDVLGGPNRRGCLAERPWRDPAVGATCVLLEDMRAETASELVDQSSNVGLIGGQNRSGTVQFQRSARLHCRYAGRRAATRRDSHDPAEIQYICVTTGFLEGAFLHRRGITNNARQRTAETICPRETEELLYAHDNVADVAVVGLADALFG